MFQPEPFMFAFESILQILSQMYDENCRVILLFFWLIFLSIKFCDKNCFILKEQTKNQTKPNTPTHTPGVKPLIHQSELRTYTKVVPFQEKSSFHFVVLW